MDRQFYIDMAESGLRMPVGTHLVLHEKKHPASIVVNGEALGRVMEETAERFNTPLAIPVMDLTIEKESILSHRGIAEKDIPTYHFTELPSPMKITDDVLLSHPRFAANLGALRYISMNTKLVPVGMCIGPFSLTTKLLADPIIPIYLAGSGMTGKDSDEVKLLDAALALAKAAVLASVKLQVAAGAKAIFLCEPAANLVYFSPNQLSGARDAFDRYVIEPNLEVREALRKGGCDLIFHDCGELVPAMVKKFAVLDPAIMSFGSPVKLWEMEPFVPKSTVIFGNLPSKKFYSDAEASVEKVVALTQEIIARMTPTGHPFIVGTECDVLSMDGFVDIIRSMGDAFMSCDAEAGEKTA